MTEPAADLAVALAVASASIGRPLPADVAAVGEVGLAGEVRQVTNLPRRLSEAPGSVSTGWPCRPPRPTVPPGLELVRVDTVAQAVRMLAVRP